MEAKNNGRTQIAFLLIPKKKFAAVVQASVLTDSRVRTAESQRVRAAGGRGSAAERRVHVNGFARAHAAALEAPQLR